MTPFKIVTESGTPKTGSTIRVSDGAADRDELLEPW